MKVSPHARLRFPRLALLVAAASLVLGAVPSESARASASAARAHDISVRAAVLDARFEPPRDEEGRRALARLLARLRDRDDILRALVDPAELARLHAGEEPAPGAPLAPSS